MESQRNVTYNKIRKKRQYTAVVPYDTRPGLSQMQLQKSLEQCQKIPKIPKSQVVQHKIGVRMINVKNRTKYHLQNKLK